MTKTVPGNRLYHYCKFETAMNHILPKQQLRLSPYEGTNDPRENKSFEFAAEYQYPIVVNNLEEKNKQISKELRTDCKLICFSQDHPPSIWGNESSRMWAYYGGGHKGLCLLLDREMFLYENKSIIDSGLLKEINYYKFDITKPIENKWVNHTAIEKMGMTQYLRNVFRPGI